MEEKKNKKKTIMEDIGKKIKKKNEKEWKKPAIEDVSGQVMAQPYIRFT